MQETSLKQMLQNIMKAQMPSIKIGVVASLDPLKVTLLNDSRVSLSTVSLMIPGRLLPFELGESFYMLTTNGSAYYMMDRV